jgi:peptide deformylase
MAVKEIRIIPDAILRQKSHKVRTQSPEYIKQVVQDLIDTATDNDAAGLSAPQIGVGLRIVVVRVSPDRVYMPIVNPEITLAYPDYSIREEGCLSLPGTFIDIKRSNRIKVRGLKSVLTFSGTPARIVQHEIDHLNGTLIIDYLVKVDV